MNDLKWMPDDKALIAPGAKVPVDRAGIEKIAMALSRAHDFIEKMTDLKEGGREISERHVSSFMPDYGHPRSRDWGMEELGVPCRVTKCSANFAGKCVSPACIEIDDDGKCKGTEKKEGEDDR